MTTQRLALTPGRSHQSKIKKFASAAKAPTSGPSRGQLFYLGLAASLREGLVSYLFMIPLGGAFDSENIPLPAVLGERTHSAFHTYGAYNSTCSAYNNTHTAHTTNTTRTTDLDASHAHTYHGQYEQVEAYTSDGCDRSRSMCTFWAIMKKKYIYMAKQTEHETIDMRVVEKLHSVSLVDIYGGPGPTVYTRTSCAHRLDSIYIYTVVPGTRYISAQAHSIRWGPGFALPRPCPLRP